MIDSYLKKTEDALRKLFDEKRRLYPERLFSAMEYSVFSSGKRVRPYLMLLSADFVDVSSEKILPLAVSLELIHNYSLIHDDLPCMDDDDFRRGKTSCHKAFGEAIALLAGDALLNLAYENLFEAVKTDPDLIMAASYLAKCAGAEGMIGGQAMEFSIDAFDETLITELCMKKTGALICAAALCPAFVCADREKFNALGTFASAIGLCFQLKDDLLDENKSEPKSYLGVTGKEHTADMVAKLGKIAFKALEPFENADNLRNLTEFLLNRTR